MISERPTVVAADAPVRGLDPDTTATDRSDDRFDRVDKLMATGFEERFDRIDRLLARFDGPTAPATNTPTPAGGNGGGGGSHRHTQISSAFLAALICLGYGIYHDTAGAQGNAVDIQVIQRQNAEQREELKALRLKVDTLQSKVHNDCPP